MNQAVQVPMVFQMYSEHFKVILCDPNFTLFQFTVGSPKQKG